MENNGMLPFLGTQRLNKSIQIQTEVYVKPVDDLYKRKLLKAISR